MIFDKQALLRPGRIDAIVEVPRPSQEDCLEILKLHSRTLPLIRNADNVDDGVDLSDLANRLFKAGCVGADVARLCQEAALASLRDGIESATTVQRKHFQTAMTAVLNSKQQNKR